MALPLFKSKERSPGATIVEERPSDTASDSSEDEGLQACAKDLLKAISSGSSQKVASALKCAFEILDSMPHDEGDDLNSEG